MMFRVTDQNAFAPLATLECVVIDCPAPRNLATFYQGLFGGSVNRTDPRWTVNDHWATLHTPSGQVVAFQGIDHYVAPQWPDSTHPQQFHLDLHVNDVDGAHARIIAAGGELLRVAAGWRVYADPAGHPFCVLG